MWLYCVPKTGKRRGHFLGNLILFIPGTAWQQKHDRQDIPYHRCKAIVIKKPKFTREFQPAVTQFTVPIVQTSNSAYKPVNHVQIESPIRQTVKTLGRRNEDTHVYDYKDIIHSEWIVYEASGWKEKSVPVRSYRLILELRGQASVPVDVSEETAAAWRGKLEKLLKY